MTMRREVLDAVPTRVRHKRWRWRLAHNGSPYRDQFFARQVPVACWRGSGERRSEDHQRTPAAAGGGIPCVGRRWPRWGIHRVRSAPAWLGGAGSTTSASDRPSPRGVDKGRLSWSRDERHGGISRVAGDLLTNRECPRSSAAPGGGPPRQPSPGQPAAELVDDLHIVMIFRRVVTDEQRPRPPHPRSDHNQQRRGDIQRPNGLVLTNDKPRARHLSSGHISSRPAGAPSLQDLTEDQSPRALSRQPLPAPSLPNRTAEAISLDPWTGSDRSAW